MDRLGPSRFETERRPLVPSAGPLRALSEADCFAVRPLRQHEPGLDWTEERLVRLVRLVLLVQPAAHASLRLISSVRRANSSVQSSPPSLRSRIPHASYARANHSHSADFIAHEMETRPSISARRSARLASGAARICNQRAHERLDAYDVIFGTRTQAPRSSRSMIKSFTSTCCSLRMLPLGLWQAPHVGRPGLPGAAYWVDGLLEPFA